MSTRSALRVILAGLCLLGFAAAAERLVPPHRAGDAGRQAARAWAVERAPAAAPALPGPTAR